MKVLVVFDATNQAEQNLQAALRPSHIRGQETPEFLICVMELLCEGRPLDDYLPEMEGNTKKALELARRYVAEAGLDLFTSLKVLRGMEMDAAQLLADQAEDWEADIIYLALGKRCDACKPPPARGGFLSGLNFFQRPNLKGELVETSPGPVVYNNPEIFPKDVLQRAPCGVQITCHGQTLFSLYLFHSPKSSRISEK